MRRLVLFLVLGASAMGIAGCFEPTYPTDLECGPDNFCPPGQTCSSIRICELNPDPSIAPDARIGPDATVRMGEIESIDIGPDLTLSLAETHTFVVTSTYSDGMQIEENVLVIWTSSSTATVFVDFQGVARPQAVGTATVTANFNGQVNSAVVTIVP